MPESRLSAVIRWAKVQASFTSFPVRRAMQASMSMSDSVNSLTELPSDDKYFIEQAKIIEEIADEGNAIIIGRCSNLMHKHIGNNPCRS